MAKQSMKSITLQEQCGCGSIYVTVTMGTDNKPCGLLVSLGKAGGCASATTSAVSELSKFAMENGLPVEGIIAALKGASCHMANKHAHPPVYSCIDAIAHAMEQVSKNTVEEKHHG